MHFLCKRHEKGRARSSFAPVKELARHTEPPELRQALASIGWMGPSYNPSQTNVDETLATQVWQNIIDGLDLWFRSNPADFHQRALPAVERHQHWRLTADASARRHYRNLCQWAICDACNKWRRCTPEYLDTLCVADAELA